METKTDKDKLLFNTYANRWLRRIW